ncbi:MAG TPA: hypothetical protein ENK26_00750 [Gammaproteobacteria bacterium]|nr:hypothetical protein [Gammaproteobacteria bacterium]
MSAISEDDFNAELKRFHGSIQGAHALPLEPGDPRYVEILQQNPASDPILHLAQRILFAESESLNLLTGFRGNGKSTELRRLKGILEDSGNITVILVNMADYVLMTKPLELGDFLLSLIAALADAARSMNKIDAVNPGYLERIWSFLKETQVEVESLEVEGDVGVATGKIGVRLQRDASFKARIQETLRGHLDGLVQKANDYIGDLVGAIQGGDPEHKVVLLVDSLEQLRGVGEDAEAVYDSTVELFSGQASNLRLPTLHVVYTIPPYLIPRAPNIARNLGGNPVCVWPNIHVRRKDGDEDPAGLEIMRTIIERRYRLWEIFYTQAQLDKLAMTSGGDIRDFFRLVREGLLGLSTARMIKDGAAKSVDSDMLNRAIVQLRNEFLPIPRQDLIHLNTIHQTKRHALEDMGDLPTLTRFLDANLIMNYLNGEPWYDVHPVLLNTLKGLDDDGEPTDH